MKKIVIIGIIAITAAIVFAMTNTEKVQQSSPVAKKEDNIAKIEQLTKKIESGEKTAGNYTQLGMLKFQAKDNNGALEALTEAEKLNAKGPTVYFYRAMVNERLHNYQEAINDCDKALEIKSDFKPAITMKERLQKRINN